MHLVGFIMHVRICHDARSPERQDGISSCASTHSRESSWEVRTCWTSYLKDMQPVVFMEEQSISSVLMNCEHLHIT